MRLNGWIPDRPDARDFTYKMLRPQNALFKAIARPARAYLHEDNFPPVFDQGQIGSCVGHGVAECCAYAMDFANGPLDGKRPEPLSRLFAYYNARQTKDEDSGAYIRDGVKGVVELGICKETVWPYDVSQWPVKPSAAAYAEAAHRANGVAYYRLETKGDRLDCIANGFPIVYGMTLFESFQQVGSDGVVPMPGRHEATIGGHCMLLIGYSMKLKAYLVRNSWGEGWGKRGMCWVPFDYIEDYASDFWTIRKMAL